MDGFHHHFSRYVYLVCGNVFRFDELLDGEEGLFMGYACGVIAKLVEVNEGFGYREDIGGVVSGGWVCVGLGRFGCEVTDLGDFHKEGFVVTKFRGYCGGDYGCWLLRFVWYSQQPVVQGCVGWGVCGCVRVP